MLLERLNLVKTSCLPLKTGYEILSLIPVSFNKIILKCILHLQCSYSYVFEIRLIWCQSKVIYGYIRQFCSEKKKGRFLKKYFIIYIKLYTKNIVFLGIFVNHIFKNLFYQLKSANLAKVFLFNCNQSFLLVIFNLLEFYN